MGAAASGGEGRRGGHEALFRAVVENSSEVVKLVDPDGTLRYASPAFERTFGYRPEEVVGKNVLDYVHPEDRQTVVAETEKALAENGTARNSASYRFRHADGSWRRVESTGTYLLDDPAVRGVVVVTRDVTERKRAEEAERRLRVVEEEHRALVETVPAVAYVEDFETGDTLYDSPQIEEILGYPRDTHERDPSYWKRIVYPGDRERVREEEARSAQTGRFSLEYRVHASDGRVVWLRDEARVIRDESGEPEAWQGLLFDVTERRRIEEELREAEERYRTIVEHTPAITYVFVQEPGGNSVPVYVSQQIERILGYTPEEYVSDAGLWRRLLHPDDRERVLAEDERTGQTGEAFHQEFRMRAKDGGFAWFREEGRLVHAGESGTQTWHGVMFDITELKETEARLREAEGRYRSLIEAIPAVTYAQRVDQTSTSTYVSPQMKDLLGYEPEECTSDPDHWLKVLHPDDRERVLEEDRRTNETGEPFKMEYRQFHKDGSVVWVRDEAVLVRDESGEPLYWLGVQFDVSGRKEYEQRLEEGEERYRSVVESVKEVIFRTDAEDRWTFLSPAWEEITGFPVAESLGERYLDFVHPGDLERNVGRMGERGGEHGRYEARFRTRQEQYRWMEVNFREHFDDEGNLSGASGTLDDITERKEAEEALKRSEERFRALVQNASDLIAVLDPQGDALYLSPSFGKIQGYDPSTRTGKNAFADVHPEDRETANAAFSELLRGDAGEVTLEFRLRASDGSWRHLEAVGRNLVSDPAVGGVVVNARDVTARKELEGRLRHQATHDQLTGLPNRVLFSERLMRALSRARRRNSELALLFIDLDDFKEVNDAFGHDAGDRVLAGVAGRLEAVVRPEDTVARFGGDEFVILLEDTNREQALSVADRIAATLEPPFAAGAGPATVTASVGVAPGGAGTGGPEELLRNADRAMYRAKEGGKARRAVQD